jgi:hypothetical protein
MGRGAPVKWSTGVLAGPARMGMKNEEDMWSAQKIRNPQSAFRHRCSDLVISIL